MLLVVGGMFFLRAYSGKPLFSILGKNTSTVTDRATPPEADEIHFTLTGQNSVTFDWRGRAGQIHYGLAPKTYTMTAEGETPSPLPTSSPFPFHEAKLTGLQEDTLYYYTIGNGGEHTFHTVPQRGATDTFTVAVEADVSESEHNPNVTVVQKLIASLKPNFVLVLGDLAYNNQTGPKAVDTHFNDMMTWSQDVAYMPIWGNHEMTGNVKKNLINYVGRFDFPNPQSSLYSKMPGVNEDWYWFDYGHTRFIAYPEPKKEAWQDWKLTLEDYNGPMAQAQTDPKIRFIVTFGHRPAYSTGAHLGETELQADMKELAAKYSKYVLNVNGHSHNYERSNVVDGVVHITAGTGGKDLEHSKQVANCLWKECPPPAWSAKRFMHHGALKLVFEQNAIHGSFLCGPPGGGITDIDCTVGEAIDSFVIQPRS